MNHWSDEIHAIFLRLSGYMNRPDVDSEFLARAGVKLDRALFPLLSRIGLSRPLGVVELADAVGRDHSTVSRQVARLEELGLVERRQSDGDQRVRHLRPTAKGQKMLRNFRIARRKFAKEHFADWTAEERRQFLRLLKKMSARIVPPRA